MDSDGLTSAFPCRPHPVVPGPGGQSACCDLSEGAGDMWDILMKGSWKKLRKAAFSQVGMSIGKRGLPRDQAHGTSMPSNF